MTDDPEVRGNGTALTTKDAIIELRTDMKKVLEYIAEQRGANLPGKVDDHERRIGTLEGKEDERKGQLSFIRGAALAGAGLGGIASLVAFLQAVGLVH